MSRPRTNEPSPRSGDRTTLIPSWLPSWLWQRDAFWTGGLSGRVGATLPRVILVVWTPTSLPVPPIEDMANGGRYVHVFEPVFLAPRLDDQPVHTTSTEDSPNDSWSCLPRPAFTGRPCIGDLSQKPSCHSHGVPARTSTSASDTLVGNLIGAASASRLRPP